MLFFWQSSYKSKVRYTYNLDDKLLKRWCLGSYVQHPAIYSKLKKGTNISFPKRFCLIAGSFPMMEAAFRIRDGRTIFLWKKNQ